MELTTLHQTCLLPWLRQHLRLNIEMRSCLARKHTELPHLTHHARPSQSAAQLLLLLLLLLSCKAHLAAVHHLPHGAGNPHGRAKLLLYLVRPLNGPRPLQPCLHLVAGAGRHNTALLLLNLLLLRRPQRLRREIRCSSGSDLGLRLGELG